MAIKTDTFTGGGAGVVTSVNTQTGAVVLSANDLAADHTATNYTAANANIDGHLSGIDTKLGTLAAGLTYKGSFNATTQLPSLINALQGDLYIIDTAGTAFGRIWAVGDHLLINEDIGGGVILNSKIDKIDNTDQVTSVNTLTGAVVLSANDLAADHTAVNYTATNANIDGHLSGIDSKLASQLESGDNISLLNNNSGFISDITGESLNDLSDVSFTAGAGIDNYVLTYDNGTSTWGAEAVPTAAAASETVAGVIEIATNAEASAATATDKALVPSNISSLDLSAMNNTTSAFISNINSESLNDLSDVSFTAGAGIDNYVLTYDNGTSTWGAEVVPSAPVTSVNTLTGAVVVSGNDIAADHTATNYTAANANVDGHFSGIDTKLGTLISDITGESLNDLSDVSFTAGAGIDNYVLTYDNGTSTWGAEAVPTASAASETVAGVIEIATNAEAGAATATDKALVPSNISSLDLSAMNNTTSAFISNINSESLNDLSDVSFTAGAGIDNYVLTYDNGTSTWGAEVVPSAPVTSVNTLTGAVVVSGNDIAADHTAVNYTAANANVDGHFSGIDTKLGTLISDITGESLNDLSDVSFTAGAGIDNYVLTYDNGTSTWGAEAVPTAAAASETVAGVIEIATNAEASAATATDKALVPSNISSLDLSAMNNTTSAFISGISGESLNDLSDVSFTAGAGIDNYVLTYDNGTSTWGAEPVSLTAPATNQVSTGINYTITQTGGSSQVYLITPSANIDISLPSAATVGDGYIYNIKNLGSYVLTLKGNGSETIDGVSPSTGVEIATQYESLTLVSNGSNWFII